MNRTDARTEIVQAANREKMRLAPGRTRLIDGRAGIGMERRRLKERGPAGRPAVAGFKRWPDTGLRREATLFSQRHLQQAVHMCRARQLVGADVLRAAGFNAFREVV